MHTLLFSFSKTIQFHSFLLFTRDLASMSLPFECGSCPKRYASNHALSTHLLRNADHVARNVLTATDTASLAELSSSSSLIPDHGDEYMLFAASSSSPGVESTSRSSHCSPQFKSGCSISSPPDSIEVPDQSLMIKFDEYCRSGYGSMIIEPQRRCEVQLLHIFVE